MIDREILRDAADHTESDVGRNRRVVVTSACGALGKELVPWTTRSSYRAPRRSGRRGRKDDRTPALFRADSGADLERKGRPAISTPSRGSAKGGGRSNRMAPWGQDRRASRVLPLLPPKAGPAERARKKCGPT